MTPRLTSTSPRITGTTPRYTGTRPKQPPPSISVSGAPRNYIRPASFTVSTASLSQSQRSLGHSTETARAEKEVVSSTEKSGRKEVSRLSLGLEALSVVVEWQRVREEERGVLIQEERTSRLETEQKLRRREEELRKADISAQETMARLGRDIEAMCEKQEAELKSQQEVSRCREETIRLEMERREVDIETKFAALLNKEEKIRENDMKEKEKLLKEVEDGAATLQSVVEEKKMLEAEIVQLEDKVSNLVITVMQGQNQEQRGDLVLRQEVHSLNVVLDMKNKKLRAAQDDLIVMKTRQTEYDFMKERIKTLQAQVEDLKVQVDLKKNSERSMEVEMSRLQRSYKKESKEKRRLSMENEQLEWRLLEGSPSCDHQTGGRLGAGDWRFPSKRLQREETTPEHAGNR